MKLIAYSSERSKSGLSRIINLISSEIDVVRIGEFDEIEKYYEQDCAFLLHNICKIKPKVLVRSIVFVLQGAVQRLIDDKSIYKNFKQYPPLALWTNSETAQRCLLAAGYEQVKVMYRPNRLVFPEQYVLIPDENRVLWYWKESRDDFNRHRQVVIEVVRQLPQIEFLFFPVKSAPVQASNVRLLERINLAEYARTVKGMVRISSEFDMGRAIYDVAAWGRWVLTYQLNEPFTIAINNLTHLAAAIQGYCNLFPDEYGLRLWQYARDNFSENVLRQKWVSDIKSIICS